MTANTFGSMGCTIERMLIAEAMKIVEESDVFGLQAKFEKSIELDNIRFINRCALSI
jgi:hypothetical protein